MTSCIDYTVPILILLCYGVLQTISVPHIVLDSDVIERGTELRLECSLNASSAYRVEDLAWYMNGNQLPAAWSEIINNNTLQLIIQEAKLSHSGNYSCRVISDINNYAKTYVRVGLKPNATLRCKSTNHVEIHCSWTEVTSYLPSNYSYAWKLSFEYDDEWKGCVETLNDNTLDPECICNGTSCHFASNHGTEHNMRLVLTNPLDTTTIRFQFNPDFDTIPNPPELVEAADITSHYITWNWREPYDWRENYKLIYRVQYSDDLSTPGVWNQEVIQKTDQTYFKLPEGKPYTDYLFKVSCISDYVNPEVFGDETESWSQWSNTVKTRTMEAAPSGRVELLERIEDAGNDDDIFRTITLSWKPVSQDERNGVIIQYNILVYVLNGTDDYNETLLISTTHGPLLNATLQNAALKYTVYPPITTLPLKDLRKDTSYLVHITAQNSAGKSPPELLTISAVTTEQRTVTETKSRIWLDVIIGLGGIIGVMSVLLCTRWSYKKVKEKGFFEPVPPPIFPFAIEDQKDCEQGLLEENFQEPLAEQYDNLKNKSDAGKQTFKKVFELPLVVNFRNSPNGSADTQITFIQDGGSGSHGNQILRRHISDGFDEDEGVATGRLVSIESTDPASLPSDDYSQMTTADDNLKQQLKNNKQRNTPKKKTQNLPTNNLGYCQVTEGGDVVMATFQVQEPSRGNRSVTPIPDVQVNSNLQSSDAVSGNGIHGNSDAVSGNGIHGNSDDMSRNGIHGNSDDRSGNGIHGNSDAMSGNSIHGNSDEDLYSQVTGMETNVRNHGDASLERNQTCSSEEDLGYSQVTASDNQPIDNQDLGHMTANQPINAQDLDHMTVNSNQPIIAQDLDHMTADQPIRDDMTGDGQASFSEGNMGYCEINADGDPMIRPVHEDCSSVWSDSDSASTNDGDCPHVSGYVPHDTIPSQYAQTSESPNTRPLCHNTPAGHVSPQLSENPPIGHVSPQLKPPIRHVSPQLNPPIGHVSPLLNPPIGHVPPQLNPPIGHVSPQLSNNSTTMQPGLSAVTGYVLPPQLSTNPTVTSSLELNNPSAGYVTLPELSHNTPTGHVSPQLTNNPGDAQLSDNTPTQHASPQLSHNTPAGHDEIGSGVAMETNNIELNNDGYVLN